MRAAFALLRCGILPRKNLRHSVPPPDCFSARHRSIAASRGQLLGFSVSAEICASRHALLFTLPTNGRRTHRYPHAACSRHKEPLAGSAFFPFRSSSLKIAAFAERTRFPQVGFSFLRSCQDSFSVLYALTLRAFSMLLPQAATPSMTNFPLPAAFLAKDKIL